MLYLLGIIAVYFLYRHYCYSKIIRRIDECTFKIAECKYYRNNTPWFQRKTYYRNGYEIEACNYWKDYYTRRYFRLKKVEQKFLDGSNVIKVINFFIKNHRILKSKLKKYV